MIVYTKLLTLLKERGIKLTDLTESGIAANTPFKFSKNRNMNTEAIDKVCAYLNVQPGDIMEYVPDEKSLERRIIQAQIDELQKKLNELDKN